MAIALALLASADPMAIQLVSHALQELSISPDVCREVPASIHLLNRRKFDAIVVDLQLGEEAGVILDEVPSSKSNRTAVTFAISGSDAAAIAAFRERSGFLFERPLSTESIRSTLMPAYGSDPERTAELLPVSHLYPRHHPETKQAGSSLLQCEHQRRGHGREYFRSAQPRRRGTGAVRHTGSRSYILGRIDGLLVENEPSRHPLCVSFA